MTVSERAKMVCSRIIELADKKERVIVAIDGRCASGKTTLAREIAEKLDCNIFHMDDFFLRPEQRSEARRNTPGENVDHERFLSEVLIPLSKGESFSYAPFDCHTLGFKPPIAVTPKSIAVVEGSYACHPSLCGYYDLRIFSDIDPDEQMRRITERNGKEGAARFKELWIPLEEAYFKAFGVKENCDLLIK